MSLALSLKARRLPPTPWTAGLVTQLAAANEGESGPRPAPRTGLEGPGALLLLRERRAPGAPSVQGPQREDTEQGHSWPTTNTEHRQERDPAGGAMRIWASLLSQP